MSVPASVNVTSNMPEGHTSKLDELLQKARGRIADKARDYIQDLGIGPVKVETTVTRESNNPELKAFLDVHPDAVLVCVHGRVDFDVIPDFDFGRFRAELTGKGYDFILDVPIKILAHDATGKLAEMAKTGWENIESVLKKSVEILRLDGDKAAALVNSGELPPGTAIRRIFQVKAGADATLPAAYKMLADGTTHVEIEHRFRGDGTLAVSRRLNRAGTLEASGTVPLAGWEIGGGVKLQNLPASTIRMIIDPNKPADREWLSANLNFKERIPAALGLGSFAEHPAERTFDVRKVRGADGRVSLHSGIFGIDADTGDTDSSRLRVRAADVTREQHADMINQWDAGNVANLIAPGQPGLANAQFTRTLGATERKNLSVSVSQGVDNRWIGVRAMTQLLAKTGEKNEVSQTLTLTPDGKFATVVVRSWNTQTFLRQLKAEAGVSLAPTLETELHRAVGQYLQTGHDLTDKLLDKATQLGEDKALEKVREYAQKIRGGLLSQKLRVDWGMETVTFGPFSTRNPIHRDAIELLTKPPHAADQFALKGAELATQLGKVSEIWIQEKPEEKRMTQIDLLGFTYAFIEKALFEKDRIEVKLDADGSDSKETTVVLHARDAAFDTIRKSITDSDFQFRIWNLSVDGRPDKNMAVVCYQSDEKNLGSQESDRLSAPADLLGFAVSSNVAKAKDGLWAALYSGFTGARELYGSGTVSAGAMVSGDSFVPLLKAPVAQIVEAARLTRAAGLGVDPLPTVTQLANHYEVSSEIVEFIASKGERLQGNEDPVQAVTKAREDALRALNEIKGGEVVRKNLLDDLERLRAADAIDDFTRQAIAVGLYRQGIASFTFPDDQGSAQGDRRELFEQLAGSTWRAQQQIEDAGAAAATILDDDLLQRAREQARVSAQLDSETADQLFQMFILGLAERFTLQKTALSDSRDAAAANAYATFFLVMRQLGFPVRGYVEIDAEGRKFNAASSPGFGLKELQAAAEGKRKALLTQRQAAKGV